MDADGKGSECPVGADLAQAPSQGQFPRSSPNRALSAPRFPWLSLSVSICVHPWFQTADDSCRAVHLNLVAVAESLQEVGDADDAGEADRAGDDGGVAEEAAALNQQAA